jgi:hypothetical protein
LRPSWLPLSFQCRFRELGVTQGEHRAEDGDQQAAEAGERQA